MAKRAVPIAAVLGSFLLLLAACETTPLSTPPSTPTPAPEYLTEEIPPCTPVHGSSGGPLRAECGPILDVYWSSHIGSGT